MGIRKTTKPTYSGGVTAARVKEGAENSPQGVSFDRIDFNMTGRFATP